MSPSSFQIWQHYLLSATSLMSLYNDILLVYASFLISDKRFTREQVKNLTTQHHHFIYYRNKSVWMQGDWFSCQPYKNFHQKWKENLTKYTRKKKTSLQSSYISSFMNILLHFSQLSYKSWTQIMQRCVDILKEERSEFQFYNMDKGYPSGFLHWEWLTLGMPWPPNPSPLKLQCGPNKEPGPFTLALSKWILLLWTLGHWIRAQHILVY